MGCPYRNANNGRRYTSSLSRLLISSFCDQDLDTNSDSPVTSIVSDYSSSSIVIAGFADGVVKVFDRRLEEEDAVVRSYSDHSSWVQNVRWHPSEGGMFLSAR